MNGNAPLNWVISSSVKPGYLKPFVMQYLCCNDSTSWSHNSRFWRASNITWLSYIVWKYNLLLHEKISIQAAILHISRQLSCRAICKLVTWFIIRQIPGSAFIKPDQLDPWIKDQIKITLLPAVLHLQLPNFVSSGRACPSHMTQNLVTVGAKLWTAERFLVDPWSMDYADPVW